MRFLLKMYVISFIITYLMGEPQCLFSNRNKRLCQDWKNMSEFVADMVSRSTVINDKINVKTNMLTLLIRAASGVIGRDTNALQNLIVNGLLLLTRTILTILESGIFNYIRSSNQKMKFIPGDHAINWITNNPYIKLMKSDAIDETLADRLGQQFASELPCVKLLVCRLSPVIRFMQRQVKETSRPCGPYEWTSWSVSNWQRVNEVTAKHCAEKLLFDCVDKVGHQ